MTVAELIEALKKYPSDMLIGRFCPGDRDGPDSLTPLFKIRDETKRVYDYDSLARNQYKEVDFIEFVWGKFI